MNVKTIITSSLTAFALLMGFYLLMPLGIDRIEGDELGSTITTINGSDKVKDSRSVINSNFANLNADKLEISAFNATTSLPQITTLANLSSVGTINSGIWNGTRLTVSYGGTGSTTLVQNALLMGNGTNGILAVPKGSDGQVLGLSSGVPTWQSVSINLNQNYGWLGYHTFTSASLASSTITNATLGTATANYPTASSSVATKGYVDAQDSLTRVKISGATATSTNNDLNWVDINVSSIVGEKPTLLFLNISLNDRSDYVCARINGASEDYSALIPYATSGYDSGDGSCYTAVDSDLTTYHGIIPVLTDASGIFELKTSLDDTAVVKIVGYIN